MNTRDIDFGEIRALSNELARQLKGQEFDCIIGVAKGGAIPATLVAYSLNIDTFKTIQIKSYNKDNTRGTTKFSSGTLSLFDELKKYKHVLLVDDLADSGKTLQGFKDLYDYLGNAFDVPKLTTACLYFKKKSEFVPDFYVQVLDDDLWVNFPWE